MLIRLAPVLLVVVVGSTIPVLAAITAEHRKEIAEIKKSVDKAQSLITKKETEEADKLLDDAEAKLKKIVDDAQIKETDAAVSSVFKSIETKRQALAKRAGAGANAGGLSFSKDIAPIISANCLRCHGDDNPRAGLQMSNFAGLEKGGGSGPLLTVGNSNNSLIMARLTAQGNQRMPRGPNPLPAADIQKIALWINQGAKFDGEDKNTALADLAKAGGGAAPKAAGKAASSGPVKIEKATGNETVSFKRDVAPWMVNLCVGCHSGGGRGAQQTGLSLDTFENLMRGGRGGRVVLPGNPNDSRIIDLVVRQDPIKMPQGQALIKRSQAMALEKWVAEGAKFDGGDPKATLRSLVPTEAELKAEELAKLSPAEWVKMRTDRADELWKKFDAKETPNKTENDEFIVWGNASEPRLKQVADWAVDDSRQLKKLFGIKDGLIWKGKLSIFVFKDRFSYSEFSLANEDREVPRETVGHARVSSVGDEAYICLQDIGDDDSSSSPGMRVSLFEHLTGGVILRSPKKVPDWAIRGTGLALAARSSPKNAFFQGMKADALQSMAGIESPADVFKDGQFSSADIGPIGYTLVTHMIAVGGEPKFAQFLKQLELSGNLNTALKDVYNADTTQLATSYLGSVGGSKTPVKKKKK
jgi:cytochrome c553